MRSALPDGDGAVPPAFTTRVALAVIALTALATTLMLQATRVFLSYTVFVVDQSKRVQLARIAVALFLAALGPDAFTSENGNRIDYVMVAGPIATREVRIPDVWTSDHKPMVAEVTVGT